MVERLENQLKRLPNHYDLTYAIDSCRGDRTSYSVQNLTLYLLSVYGGSRYSFYDTLRHIMDEYRSSDLVCVGDLDVNLVESIDIQGGDLQELYNFLFLFFTEGSFSFLTSQNLESLSAPEFIEALLSDISDNCPFETLVCEAFEEFSEEQTGMLDEMLACLQKDLIATKGDTEPTSVFFENLKDFCETLLPNGCEVLNSESFADLATYNTVQVGWSGDWYSSPDELIYIIRDSFIEELSQSGYEGIANVLAEPFLARCYYGNTNLYNCGELACRKEGYHAYVYTADLNADDVELTYVVNPFFLMAIDAALSIASNRYEKLYFA